MFDELAALSENADDLFEELARQLAAQRKFHELFDARLAQSRQRLGLPLEKTGTLDDIPEPDRSNLEQGYLEACREVGQLLLDAGQFREAWMYLRPAAEKAMVHKAMERVIPTEENVEELIQIALHEGVDPERGLGWMLGHYGTCNSVTTFEGMAGALELADQQRCAAVLVRHLHDELIGNVRAHIEQREGKPPSEQTLTELIAQRDWLFENDNYHVDTSHLGAVVRFARLLEDQQTARLALALCEYGRRLGKQLQYPGEPPFADTFPSHLRLFSATLGEQVEEAIDYFAGRAKTVSADEHGAGAIETYLIVLNRAGQHEVALAAYGELVPAKMALSPYAPTPLELARKSGAWDVYFQIMREREDAVGFAIGQLEALVGVGR